MSTIRKVKGTLKNVTWVNVWCAGCEDVGTIHYSKRDTIDVCRACGVCDMKVQRVKVIVGGK